MSVALDVATIDVTLHSDEPKAARAVSTDLDEGWTENVTRIAVPEVHLDGLPATCHSRLYAPNLATASRRSRTHRVAGSVDIRGDARNDSRNEG
jgi:hypothetical protein